MSTCPQLSTLFNPMHITEPLDISNHHSHIRVPHHLKCISLQGFWMILIRCRTVGDGNPSGWLFFGFLVVLSQTHNPKTRHKVRRTSYKMAKIAQIKSTHLQPDHQFRASHVRRSPNTPDTAYIFDSDTDTQFLLDVDVSSFSGSGIG